MPFERARLDSSIPANPDRQSIVNHKQAYKALLPGSYSGHTIPMRIVNHYAQGN